MVRPVTHAATSEYTTKEKLTSVKAWELKKEPSAFAPAHIWSNSDMEPVPRELWSWTTLTFAAYWFSDLINPGSWSQVSSFVSLGLTWWESLLATLTGGVILASVVALNGIVGAKLHTPFAVTSRAAFGYHLSKFCVISRMVIAWFWFSINTYQGGTGIQICLTAIWPSFAHLPNHLPESSGTTTAGMLCFFLFWLIQFPFCLIHPSNLRLMFLIKGCTVPIVAIGMMGWSIHKAGDQASAVMKASSTVHGLNGYFAFMTAVNACISTWSTLACNIGDFSRYSKKPTSALTQVAVVPMLWTICALFGAITANMTNAIYGELLFQPFDICALWLDNRGGRAAAFFCSLVWAMANMTTNITANSISSANDLTTLFPRWVNIFRGQLFAITVGVWAFAPWKVLSSAGSFISFMGSYAIVLAPIAAILCADFYLVKGQKIDVPALYDPNGIYRYGNTLGINWRALVALVVSIGPNMPGMINALNSSIDIGNVKYLYAIACIFGMVVGAGVYTTLSWIFPAHATLISEAVYAQDVLDARGSDNASHEEKDYTKAGVAEV
ncbi:NCS2 allantoate transporter [Pseudohyphozyma bogoriensis]|nr:NCS2 allantoate transporter [Pseudohyphozyma bogoriensis]